MYQNYRIATKIPNGTKIYLNIFQMAIENANLSRYKACQNLPKLGFLV
jgi:hypothetical protein